MAETKTIGTVGQTYENRKTGKVGTLVEVNDKYRTLLMESPDGGTFNISFASLKSNWRKAKDDVVADKTPTIESEPTNIMEFVDDSVDNGDISDSGSTVENVVNFEEHKSTHTKSDITTNMFKELVDCAVDFVADFEKTLGMSTMSSRRGIALKIGRRNVIEIYSRTFKNSYEVFMKEDFYREVKWTESLNIRPADVMYDPSWRLTTHFYVPENNLSVVLSDISPVLSELVDKFNTPDFETEEIEKED